MRKYFFASIFFWNIALVHAQEFTGEASLPEISKDGFYKIFISPDASIYLNNRFTDIRIFDNNKREVPFIFQEEPVTYSTEQFKEYAMLEKKQIKKCCTSLILHNPERNTITNIHLWIKNADVRKEATLLGSDDREQWFALKQHFTFYSINNRNSTSEVKIVDFPLSNYTYYSVQIDDSTSAPINILKAGYYELSSKSGSYSEVPILKITSADSTHQKKSYLRLVFDTLRFVDKLDLSMTGAPYFRRKAFLYEKKEWVNKKGKPEQYNQLLESFTISSSGPTTIYLPRIKVRELLIEIENEDNPTLTASSTKAYQLNRYLTAWLSKDNQYKIKLGNANLDAPSYDLSFFKDSIPDAPPVIPIGSVNLIQKETVTEASSRFFTSKQIIWIAIVLVIAVLGFMSVRMIREVNTKKNGA